jgi:lysozyme family protein
MALGRNGSNNAGQNRNILNQSFSAFLQITYLVILSLKVRFLMADALIDRLIEVVIEREGGYVNHPADRGGPTNWGVTQAVARAQGYTGDMRHLPQGTAVSIYKRLYWISPGYSQIAVKAPNLAAELFDTGINMGTGTATRFLQRALNALNRNAKDFSDIKVDGQTGPATMAALQAFLRVRADAGEAVILKAVEALQGAHYLRLAETRPSQEAFLYGWLANRIG